MHFHANYVSTSVFGDGDYYQATFQAEQDTDDPDSPYLLIQREFEDPDDHRCYIETHDEKYCGHFLLRRVDFTPQKLSIELDRPRDNFVTVTFAMVATEFAEASQVVRIILVARSSLPDARAAKSNVRTASLASVRAHSKRVR
jgi:hypothetical protein